MLTWSRNEPREAGSSACGAPSSPGGLRVVLYGWSLHCSLYDCLGWVKSLSPCRGPHFVHMDTGAVITSLALPACSPAHDHKPLKTLLELRSTVVRQLLGISPQRGTGIPQRSDFQSFLLLVGKSLSLRFLIYEMRRFRQIWGPYKNELCVTIAHMHLFLFLRASTLWWRFKTLKGYDTVGTAMRWGACVLILLILHPPWLAGFVTPCMSLPNACTERSSALASPPTYFTLPCPHSITRPTQISWAGGCCLFHLDPNVLTFWCAGVSMKQDCCLCEFQIGWLMYSSP